MEQEALVYIKKLWSASGLHFKPITIVNDDSKVVNKLETSLTDDASAVIYDLHMFIVQATEASSSSRGG